MTYEMIEAEDLQVGQRLREADDACILTVAPSGDNYARFIYITLDTGRSCLFHKHDMVYVESNLTQADPSAIQETP